MEIFELLRQSRRANQLASDMEGRSQFFELGIVTDNADPLNKRRVKVTLQSKGGQTQTDWLFRLVPSPHDDPPVPRIGQTVGVMFCSGDPHQGVYFGAVTNMPNPEQATDAPILDDSRRIEGDRIETIEQNDDQRIDQNQVVSVGKNLTLQNDAGASLTLHESGAVILKDRWNNKLVLGGASGGLSEPTDFVWQTLSGNVRWDLNNNQIDIINADDVSINGKSAIVIGSTDSDGDTNNNRGY